MKTLKILFLVLLLTLVVAAPSRKKRQPKDEGKASEPKKQPNK